MSLGYEFAPIDVSIITHDKVLDIERRYRLAAFGLWCWGQCYARTHRTGGLLRRSAVLASLAASVTDMQKLAAELVRVGLWVSVEEGWTIHNFEKKTSRSSSSAERMRRLRGKRKSDGSDADVTSHPVTSDASPVTQCSVSVSSSISSSGESAERGPPGWFRDGVVAAVEMAGLRVDAVEPRWLEYKASRSRKTWAMNHEDAVGWLVAVLRREKREADARPRRDGPPEVPRETPEQARAFSKQLAANLLAAKRGAA